MLRLELRGTILVSRITENWLFRSFTASSTLTNYAINSNYYYNTSPLAQNLHFPTIPHIVCGSGKRGKIKIKPMRKGEKNVETTKKTRGEGLTRRDALKLSGLVLGGLAISGSAGKATAGTSETTRAAVPAVLLSEPPASNEMRISFFGTWYTPRPNQACNSVFVELGNGDSFVFDCGSGVVSRYVAMGVAYSRMDKVFLTHLHGDHMNDLITIYCFGPRVIARALCMFGGRPEIRKMKGRGSSARKCWR